MSNSNLGAIGATFADDHDRVALIDEAAGVTWRVWTYADLDRFAGGVSRLLTDREIGAGDHVGILSYNRAEYVAAYLGVMRVGAVAVPMNIRQPRTTLASIAEESRLRLLFCDTDHADVLADSVPTIRFGARGDDGFDHAVTPDRSAVSEVGPNDVAELLYTSGSTGRPKGVPLTHAGQLWALRALLPFYATDGTSQTRIVAQPLFHMNGLVTVSLGLMAGDRVVLQPRFDTETYLAALERHRITSVGAVPTMWARVLNMLERGRDADLSSIRRLSLGSAPVTQELLDRTRRLLPDVHIGISYGTTEAGPAVFGPHPDGLPTPDLSIGHPLPGTEWRLVDGPNDREGVLWMRNPATMEGYLDQPQQSAARLRDGWYDSGDLMRRDEHGFFYFVGRADDMFVCGGENIYPGEVEIILDGHPGVLQSAVVSLPDDERGRIPVAFLVPRSGAAPSFAEIRDHVVTNAPPYLYPRRVAYCDELPLAGTNKVDRAALQRRAYELEREDGWVSS